MKQRKSRKILFICLAILLGVLAVTMVITHCMIRQEFGRGSYPEYATADYFYKDYQDTYEREYVNFMSGKNRLQGYVYGSENDKGLLVFSHGIGGGHENYINEIIWFVDQGWRVFAYDATGSCESEGDGTIGLVQSALDLDAALTYIEEENSFSGLPVCLLGHSWGGYGVGAVLQFSHEIAASVSISGYAYPMEMMMEYVNSSMGKAGSLLYPFVWLDTYITFGKNVSLSAIDGINSGEVPVLVIHGTADEMIGFNGAAIIAKKEQITNPNVRYLIMNQEGQNGHNNLFRNEDSIDYIQTCNDMFGEIYDSYGGDVPDDIRLEYIDSLDKEKINQCNEELLSQIQDFFEAAISHVDF